MKVKEEPLQREPEGKARPAMHPGLRAVLELARTVVIAVAVALFLTRFVGGLARTVGPSMEPTLRDGDILLTRYLAYHPRPGDVVMARSPWEDRIVVKRVAALAGQQVEIDYELNQVRVDGQVLEEPYVEEPMEAPRWDYISQLEVPQGCCFLLGDNRNVSADSRDPELGPVPESDILGQALCILWPLDHFRLLT